MNSHNYQWLPEARPHIPHTPLILVGTQMDLLEDPETIKQLSAKNQTPITFQQAFELANELGAFAFVPISREKVRPLSSHSMLIVSQKWLMRFCFVLF